MERTARTESPEEQALPARKVRPERTLRLSTAEAADEVIVVDKGRVVQRGPHAELVTQAGGVYSGLHASWVAQHSHA